jgi:plastocyanin
VEKALPGNLGQSGDLTLILTPGTYEIYCPVNGHRAKGMKGSIKVVGTEGQPAPTTTTSSTQGGGY